MKDKELLNLWQRGNDLMKNGQINHDQIKKLLKPRINRLSTFVRSQLFTYLLAQIVSIFLLSYNMYGYRGNIIMQAVSLALILFSGFFIFFGIGLFKSYKQINQQHSDIFSLLKEKINFFHHKFEWWNFVTAASLWILIFAINTFVDNAGGVYRINKPFVFFGTSLGIMVFIYSVNKFSAGMLLKETRVCLRDLKNAWAGNGESFTQIKKRHLKIKIILIVICFTLFIIGLLVFLNRS